MTTHKIDIEGLPEGWKVVAIRKPIKGEYIFHLDQISKYLDLPIGIKVCHIIVEKTKQRRIVLEETDELNPNYVPGFITEFKVLNGKRIWREVKEGE